MKCPRCNGTGEVKGLENRIRIINITSGEVKETDACLTGVESLAQFFPIFLEDEECTKEDIVIEGHPYFKGILEKRLRKL